jgi:hypothetical protein
MRCHVLGDDGNLMCLKQVCIAIPFLSLFMIEHRGCLVRAAIRTPVVLVVLLIHSNAGVVGPL